LQNQHGQIRNSGLQIHRGNDKQNDGDETHFQDIGQLVFADKFAQSFERIQPAEIGCNGFQARNPAARCDSAEHGNRSGDGGKNDASNQAGSDHLLSSIEHGLGLGELSRVEGELLAQASLQVVKHRRGKRHNAQRSGSQHRQVPQVTRTSHLPVAACFIKLLLGSG